MLWAVLVTLYSLIEDKPTNQYPWLPYVMTAFGVIWSAFPFPPPTHSRDTHASVPSCLYDLGREGRCLRRGKSQPRVSFPLAACSCRSYLMLRAGRTDTTLWRSRWFSSLWRQHVPTWLSRRYAKPGTQPPSFCSTSDLWALSPLVMHTTKSAGSPCCG